MKSKQNIVATLAIQTSDGVFAAHYSATGLAKLDFPRKTKIMETPAVSPVMRRWHHLACRAVSRSLQGQPTGSLPPLDMTGGTAFQARVWTAMREIPAGKTKTYGEIAAALGRPKGARAVGGSCGANPIPLLIPCHRVLATGGALGGFSGGLDWKRKLLTAENTPFRG